LSVCAILSFYGWLVLCFADYAPVSMAPVQMGGFMGNYSDPKYNSIYYLSTRYGYFSGWNSSVHNDTVIEFTQEVNTKAGEMPGSMVGYQMGRSMRIETLGWWFFFCFVIIMAKFRADAREVLRIPGSMIEDFCCVALFWPTVLYQVEYQFEHGKPKAEKESVAPTTIGAQTNPQVNAQGKI